MDPLILEVFNLRGNGAGDDEPAVSAGPSGDDVVGTSSSDTGDSLLKRDMEVDPEASTSATREEEDDDDDDEVDEDDDDDDCGVRTPEHSNSANTDNSAPYISATDAH